MISASAGPLHPRTVSCVFSLGLYSTPQDCIVLLQSWLILCTPGLYSAFTVLAGPLHPRTMPWVFNLTWSSAPLDYLCLGFSASAGPLHPKKTTQTQYSKHLCALPFGGLAGGCTQRPSKLRRQHLPPMSEHPCDFFSTPDRYPFFCQQPQIMSVMLKFTHVYL